MLEGFSVRLVQTGVSLQNTRISGQRAKRDTPARNATTSAKRDVRPTTTKKESPVASQTIVYGVPNP